MKKKQLTSVSFRGQEIGLGAYYAREDGQIVSFDGTVLSVYQDGTVLVRPDSGRPQRIPAHRLIAAAFVRNDEEYAFVQFKDGNKKNRKPDNLVWVKGGRKGTRATDLEIAIMVLHKKKKKVSEIAAELDISTMYVYKVLKKNKEEDKVSEVQAQERFDEPFSKI